MSNIPADLQYTREHEWVKVEGNTATIGITDHAQTQLGDMVFVELPQTGRQAEFMKPIGVVESVKAASDIFSPLSGRVTAVNDELVKAPELVNQDCYGRGWLFRLELSDPAQLAQLLDQKQYAALLAQ